MELFLIFLAYCLPTFCPYGALNIDTSLFKPLFGSQFYLSTFNFYLAIGYWLLNQSKICLLTNTSLVPCSLFLIPYSKIVIRNSLFNRAETKNALPKQSVFLFESEKGITPSFRHSTLFSKPPVHPSYHQRQVGIVLAM